MTSVTTILFLRELLRLQTEIALYIFQALDIADINNFFRLWLSNLQIAALGKASMQNVILNSASLAFLYGIFFPQCLQLTSL